MINSKGRHPILFVRFLFIMAVHVLCIHMLYYIVSSVGYENVKKLNISSDDGQALQKAIRETFCSMQNKITWLLYMVSALFNFCEF